MKNLDSVLKEAIEDYFLETTGSHADKAVVEEIFDIVKSNSNYPECNDTDIEISVNNWLVSIKEDDNTTNVSVKDFKDKAEKEIKEMYFEILGEEPNQTFVESIRETIFNNYNKPMVVQQDFEIILRRVLEGIKKMKTKGV